MTKPAKLCAMEIAFCSALADCVAEVRAGDRFEAGRSYSAARKIRFRIPKHAGQRHHLADQLLEAVAEAERATRH